MEKEFVSYEQALALKEFDIAMVSFGQYWRDKDDNKIYLFIGDDMVFEDYDAPGLSDIEFICSAPLKQQAFRWFREKHNLHSEILLGQTTYPKYCFEIHRYEDFGNYEKIENRDWSLHRTFNEAESACLDKLIEIKEKQN